MDAYGGSQPLPAPQQQAQQRYGGAGAARELWPPQPGGHPIAQQHGHVGMPGSGGQYMEGYGAGVSGAGSPTGAHAAGAYAASPSGGGAGRQPKGGFGGSPQGLGGNGNGKPSRGRPPVTKKRPAEGAAPPKQPKKKKVRLQLEVRTQDFVHLILCAPEAVPGCGFVGRKTDANALLSGLNLAARRRACAG